MEQIWFLIALILSISTLSHCFVLKPLRAIASRHSIPQFPNRQTNIQALSNAQEAIQLLHGQQLEVPSLVVYSTILIVSYFMQQTLFRVMSKF